MEEVPEVSEAQRAAYDELKTLFGLEHVEFIISQGPEVVHARLEAFMRYEASLIGQVQDHLAASMPPGTSLYLTQSRGLALKL